MSNSLVNLRAHATLGYFHFILVQMRPYMFSWASLMPANIITEEKFIFTTLLSSHKTIVIILPTDILLLWLVKYSIIDDCI